MKEGKFFQFNQFYHLKFSRLLSDGIWHSPKISTQLSSCSSSLCLRLYNMTHLEWKHNCKFFNFKTNLTIFFVFCQEIEVYYGTKYILSRRTGEIFKENNYYFTRFCVSPNSWDQIFTKIYSLIQTYDNFKFENSLS